MSVPVSIQKLLTKHNVVYSLADIPSPLMAGVHLLNKKGSKQVARAQLLVNGRSEKLLAITPSQSVVDLRAIEQALGESYTPIVGDALSKFAANLGLESMAAMPQLAGLLTIVDKSLLQHDTLLLSLGISEQYIQLDSDSFKKLLESTTVSEISTSLNVINSAPVIESDAELITQGIEQFTELRVQRRLEETLDLPPLPAIAQRIIQLRVDPNADISDLCEAIELDASLAAQVMSWAASPYYSAPGTIKSIHDAIVRVLGFDIVMNLALGLALGATLKLPERTPAGCLSYWQQSVYVATCTEALISCMPRDLRPSYGSSYLSGLLHNFGYLIMAEVFGEKFDTIHQHIESNPHVSIEVVESQIIGVGRDRLASWLMASWNLPEEVCIGLRHQNNPDYDGEHWQYPLLIHITKKLLNEQGIRMGVSEDPLPDSVLERFQINRGEAMEAMSMILESQEMLQEIAGKMKS